MRMSLCGFAHTGACSRQKTVSNFLELELQAVVGPMNQTWVLWENSTHS